MFDYSSGAYEDHPLFTWLRDLRRDFHMHPETAYKEVWTTERIKEELTRLGVGIVELPEPSTGVVGLITGNGEGKTLGIRADIDALPVQDAKDVPYKSRHQGKMHACGHDAHTAILLGVAKQLVESGMIEQIPGNVKLIFQPAEEVLSGAAKMVAGGVMDSPKVDCMLALHVTHEYEVGKIGLKPGPNYAAAAWFSYLIKGQGVHAAVPHKGIDPIYAGADLVSQIQSIVSRRVDPEETLVISVGRFQAGDAPNVIPDTVDIRGTVRHFNPEVEDKVKQHMEDLASGLERSHGVRVEFDFNPTVAVLKADPEVTELVREAASHLIGEDNIMTPATRTGSEDFAEYLTRAPGSIFYLGCRDLNDEDSPFAHSPLFDLDERCLPLGVDVFVQAVRGYFTMVHSITVRK
jgi:amidohydrolase